MGSNANAAKLIPGINSKRYNKKIIYNDYQKKT